jgi:hypothetical protein
MPPPERVEFLFLGTERVTEPLIAKDGSSGDIMLNY